ncbi:MAG: hypothetical protein VR64_03870 [Desulfatitalea sp. BRH_c12]|nr:MAG: hypothetical protein VR64_03870 [Desulfatitalea sp. BRH_c12]
MKHGRWVPISKALARYLPSGRPYTKLEAAFSLQLDYDQRKPVTLSGYAALWGWSKGRVLRYFSEMGIKIDYPVSTKKKQNQTGLIMILKSDRQRPDNRMIRLIDSKCLDENNDRTQNENGLKKNRSRYPTMDPDTYRDPDKSPPTPPDEENSAYSLSFETWWKQYPRKIAKDDAFKAWQKIGKTNTTTVQQLIQAIQKQVEGKHFRGRDGQDYVPNPATWLNQGRWKDEIKEHIHKGEEYVV